MLDLLIKGGLVYDGRGRPPRRADVAVAGGRVRRIASEIAEPARETIDASGLWVAPGFLDIHTHYDIELELAPGLSESVRHGVTTVVMGNCSLSLTLGDPQTLADIFLRVENIPGVLVRKWLARAVAWDGPEGYFDHLERLPLGPNVAPLLGHSALRAAAMGLERSLTERATDADLERMEDLAVSAFEAGCAGLSVDMVPWHMMSGRFKGRAIPSHHAGSRELRRLAELCRERDLVFQVTPNPHQPLSVFLILGMSVGLWRPALRATVLTALDAVAFRPLRHFFPPLLFAMNRLLGGNLRFQTLTEPFTVYSDGPITPLFEEFPAGVALNDCETRAQRRALWASPGFRRRFASDWGALLSRSFHRRLELMTVVRCPDRSLEGLTFSEIAARRGREPVDCFMDLLAEHDEDVRWISVGGNDREAPRRALLSHPHIQPGFTDAGAHVRNLAFQDGPLALLRESLESGFMTPERAIERCTGEAAEWFRLDAGVLEAGRRADVVLLDPAGLRDAGEALEIRDPLLDGAARMVKRGSEKAVRAVFIAGRLASGSGEAGPALGREALGRVLRPLPSDEVSARRLRNRIDDRTVDHPFTRYWDVFVLKHQDPRNVALHCVGVVVFYGLLAAAALTRSPWWLAALPSSQLIGLLGHRLFEPSFVDPQDAVFSLRASACLNVMFWRVITGRYAGDVARLRARLERYRRRAAAPRPREEPDAVAA